MKLNGCTVLGPRMGLYLIRPERRDMHCLARRVGREKKAYGLRQNTQRVSPRKPNLLQMVFQTQGLEEVSFNVNVSAKVSLCKAQAVAAQHHRADHPRITEHQRELWRGSGAASAAQRHWRSVPQTDGTRASKAMKQARQQTRCIVRCAPVVSGGQAVDTGSGALGLATRQRAWPITDCRPHGCPWAVACAGASAAGRRRAVAL